MDNMFKLMGFWTGIFAVMFLCRRHAASRTSFCCEHCFLPTTWVFESNRAYVHVLIWSISDDFHGRIQLLHNVYTRTRRWPLRSTYKKTAFYNGCFFVFYFINCSKSIQKWI